MINILCFLHYFNHSERKKILTQYWQFLHKGVSTEILSRRLVMDIETKFLPQSTHLFVCLSYNMKEIISG